MSDDDTRKVRDFLTPQRREDVRYAYGRMLGYAQGKLRLQKAEAEEVVQKATVRAIERISQYQERPGVPFVAWLKKVLLNLVRDEYRSRLRAGSLRDTVSTSTTPSLSLPPDIGVANSQAKELRDRVLEALSRDARAVFEIWAQQNAKHIDREEAASRLGCSVAEYEAAKKRVRREVESIMNRLGLSAEDLRSELPLAQNPKRALGHGEENL